mmetsp:Transcript_83617/g.132484  ORF Transcript_83617/g.132484 Transcript_83617/m.132484 type:complete len:200 (-) Transcript_83617:981-1580(-)
MSWYLSLALSSSSGFCNLERQICICFVSFSSICLLPSSIARFFSANSFWALSASLASSETTSVMFCKGMFGRRKGEAKVLLGTGEVGTTVFAKPLGGAAGIWHTGSGVALAAFCGGDVGCLGGPPFSFVPGGHRGRTTPGIPTSSSSDSSSNCLLGRLGSMTVTLRLGGSCLPSAATKVMGSRFFAGSSSSWTSLLSLL